MAGTGSGRLAGRVAVVTADDGPIADASRAALARLGADVHLLRLRDARPDAVDVLHVTGPRDADAWCRAVVPGMAARGGGAVVTTVSTRALAGDVDGLDDATAGGAVVALTLGLATTHGKRGVRVNCVAVPPTGIPHDVAAASTLVPRAFRPEDAAGVAAWLVSDEASFVTGQVLRCDGGQLAHLPHYASLLASGASTVGGRR